VPVLLILDMIVYVIINLIAECPNSDNYTLQINCEIPFLYLINEERLVSLFQSYTLPG
jgi:hypothetical protein